MRRFAYRLALKLGRVDVDRMLGEISMRQLLEWMAFWRLEPFGPLQEARYFGQLIASVINGNPFRKRKGVVKAEDVFPWLKEGGRKRQSPEQLRQMIEVLAAAFGGELKRTR